MMSESDFTKFCHAFCATNKDVIYQMLTWIFQILQRLLATLSSSVIISLEDIWESHHHGHHQSSEGGGMAAAGPLPQLS